MLILTEHDKKTEIHVKYFVDLGVCVSLLCDRKNLFNLCIEAT